MKIVQLKTHMPVKAGSAKAEVYFTTDAHSMHRGLIMETAVDPKLGAGIMIETELLKKSGRVSFCPVNNVEEIVFAKDEEPVKAKK